MVTLRQLTQRGRATYIYVAAYGSRLKDWPRLEENVDEKIEEIESFCAFWKSRVRNEGRYKVTGVDQRQLEQQSGISHQTVALWRKELKNKPKFRTKIILATYRKAGFEPAENPGRTAMGRRAIGRIGKCRTVLHIIVARDDLFYGSFWIWWNLLFLSGESRFLVRLRLVSATYI